MDELLSYQNYELVFEDSFDSCMSRAGSMRSCRSMWTRRRTFL